MAKKPKKSPAPATALDICNRALALLQEPPIDRADSNGSPAERSCYWYYHSTRREVLCTQEWPFATISASLLGGNGVFHLPDDCLRLLNVEADGWLYSPPRTIVCHGKTAINVTYTADCEDVTRFSPDFIEAFVNALAVALSKPLNIY